LLVEKAVWHDRYRSIVDLERHLHGNGTASSNSSFTSPKKSSEALLERIDDPQRTGSSASMTSRSENTGSTI